MAIGPHEYESGRMVDEGHLLAAVELDGLGGVGPIPFVAIDRYAERFGVAPGDDFVRFHTLLKRMDATFLEHMAEKAKQKQEPHA